MEKQNPYLLDVVQIQQFIPHRPPFLLIDRIVSIESTDEEVGTRVKAIKNLTMNEPFFMGHFPDFPVMPGVLQIEAMAQAACFSVYPRAQRSGDVKEFSKKFSCLLVKTDECRFRQPVVPGDQLEIETTVEKIRNQMWFFDCHASVNGKRVAEAKLMANLVAEEGKKS